MRDQIAGLHPDMHAILLLRRFAKTKGAGMSIGRFAVASAITLSVATASPARAANCSILQDHYQQFENDRSIALKELARVNAAHPNDGHFYRDRAYCMALRQTMDDTLLLLIVDNSCFRSEEGAAEFKASIGKVGRAAASETGFYCSQADLQAPLRPRQ
jgi:hypothetical protein